MNRKLLIFILFFLSPIFLPKLFQFYAIAGEKSKTEFSFQGKIKSGVFDIINNKFGIRIELYEHPNKVFLLISGSDASKSMGTFELNKQVLLKCRKGVPSDSSITSPAKIDVFHIIEFKYN